MPPLRRERLVRKEGAGKEGREQTGISQPGVELSIVMELMKQPAYAFGEIGVTF
jgi:hypothetical protein